MATVTCPECQESVFSEAKVCPNCGYPLKKHTTSNFEFKFDPELAYKIAKEDCKESFIKLIIPVLWLAVPWLLLWIFTTMENIYSFMISFAVEHISTSNTYSEKGEAIDIMYKDGSVRDIADASEMLNMETLTYKPQKIYLFHLK